jgi:hypothetical protein
MKEKRTLFIECKDIVLNVSQTIDELQDYFIKEDSSLTAEQINEKVKEYLAEYPHKVKKSPNFDALVGILKERFNIVLLDVVSSEAQYSFLEDLAKRYGVTFRVINEGVYESGCTMTVGDEYLLCSSLSLAYRTNARKIFYMPTKFYSRLNGYLFKYVTPVRSWNAFLKKVGYTHV